MLQLFQKTVLISKNRNISALDSRHGDGSNATGSGGSSIYNADGSISTGYIPNFKSLPLADKKKVIAERKRLGIKMGGGGVGGGGGRSGNTNAAKSNQLKQLQKQNKKYKRTIKALKKHTTNDNDDSDDASENDGADAGDQFGGKNTKKKLMKKCTSLLGLRELLWMLYHYLQYLINYDSTIVHGQTIVL